MADKFYIAEVRGGNDTWSYLEHVSIITLSEGKAQRASELFQKVKSEIDSFIAKSPVPAEPRDFRDWFFQSRKDLEKLSEDETKEYEALTGGLDTTYFAPCGRYKMGTILDKIPEDLVSLDEASKAP